MSFGGAQAAGLGRTLVGVSVRSIKLVRRGSCSWRLAQRSADGDATRAALQLHAPIDRVGHVSRLILISLDADLYLRNTAHIFQTGHTRHA